MAGQQLHYYSNVAGYLLFFLIILVRSRSVQDDALTAALSSLDSVTELPALHNVISTISAMFEPNRSETRSRAAAEFEALTWAPGTTVASYVRRAVVLRGEAGPDRIPVVSTVKVISAALAAREQGAAQLTL